MKLVKQISFAQHLLTQNKQQRYILHIKMQAVQHYTFIKTLQSLVLYFCFTHTQTHN